MQTRAKSVKLLIRFSDIIDFKTRMFVTMRLTMDTEKMVWVFNSIDGKFPSAVFSRKELAEDWIKLSGLTGILTAYPLDISVYDWAVNNGYFSPKRDEHRTP